MAVGLGARPRSSSRTTHLAADRRLGGRSCSIAGTGVGVAWPHLSAWIMGAVDDPVEAGAAAAINTVQLISGAFGAGLAGVVVNMSTGGDLSRGPLAFHRFRGAGRIGFVATYRATRGR